MAILFFGGYDPNSKCDWEYREAARYGTLVFWTVSHVLIRAALSRYWTSFQLTDFCVSRGQTRSQFILKATNSVQAGINCLLLGPAALYISYTWSSSIPVSEGIVLVNVNETNCEYWAAGAFCGTLFGGWAMYQILQLLVGWEEGNVVLVVHHIAFTTLGLAIPYYWVLPELTTFAVSMELSGPFLELMLIFRELKGHESLTSAASLTFGICFLVVRVFYFGYGLLRSLSFWHQPPQEAIDALGDRVPAVMAMQGFYVLGYCIQLIWARTITQKLLGYFGGKSAQQQVEKLESFDKTQQKRA